VVDFSLFRSWRIRGGIHPCQCKTRRMKSPNQVTGANSRPASPFTAGQQFGSASCAPPSLSAAVAQFWR
jgi:hypothetical protein